MDENIIIEEIDSHREDYIEFFRELIQTKSYNPPGDEMNVAVKLQAFFQNNDIKCEVFPFGENRANLIAHVNKNFDHCLLYNGHMDTVPPGPEDEWRYSPLSAHIRRKKFIYGRGTTDMKAGLAAMAISMQILKKLNIQSDKNLVLCAVGDEETSGILGGLWSVENVLKARNIKSDFCVVGESTGLEPLPKAIIVGEKGHVRIKIITHGIAAHSSIPFEGKNAIYMMSDIIQHLDKLDNYLPNVPPPIPEEKLKALLSEVFPDKDVFEKIFNEQPILRNFLKALTTLTRSLNLIEGGIKDNVVPEKCEAIMDFRTFPGQTGEMIKNALEQVVKDSGYPLKEEGKNSSEHVYAQIEIIDDSDGSYWEDWEDSELIKEFKSIAERIYERASFYSLFPAASDARTFRNTNYCPSTILFGPGNATLPHTTDEYIEIDDFMRIIKVYTLFAYKYLSD
ncbi:MAG: N-formyl-4-amino-5-aminomethyl-2-methylpyrimidine deformylase [Promethearchaeota archaeon]|nr:MAG: N-formyl-4-amino-5-aminomethyl-2-methylpyrimidine deformylase [Candidatus Lokiarchaeota archaeon]